MIYFDNGATTYPKPKRVPKAVENAFYEYGANPGRSGHEMAMQTALKVYECRETAASLFHHTEVENVVFSLNCTHAINMALKGALRWGDHVIISDLEHNSVLRPVHCMAQRGAITYSVATVQSDDDETVAAFESLIRPNTRMIACTHGSNVFGIRLPAEKIGALCRRHGLLFLLDAAQTAGIVDIDVDGWGVAFLCTAGHKSLYGPTGTGLLITPFGEALETIMEGGTGSYSAYYDMPPDMPDHLESGTVNTMGIVGLLEGMRFVEEKGVDALYRHEMEITGLVYHALKSMPGVELYTPLVAGKSLPVLSFNVRGKSSEETTDLLSEKGFALRGGLHCAPLAHKKMGTINMGTARISVGAFNTKEQAARLCDEIKKISA